MTDLMEESSRRRSRLQESQVQESQEPPGFYPLVELPDHATIAARQRRVRRTRLRWRIVALLSICVVALGSWGFYRWLDHGWAVADCDTAYSEFSENLNEWDKTLDEAKAMSSDSELSLSQEQSQALRHAMKTAAPRGIRCPAGADTQTLRNAQAVSDSAAQALKSRTKELRAAMAAVSAANPGTKLLHPAE